MKRLEHARVLMYSHDTFGLGHLRRCRTIAHALVEQFKGLNVLIISGSPIAGAFDFKARVDFVKIPSVIKLHNGQYTSLDEHIDLEETLKMRRSIIRHTAEHFNPDMFIVDKEPLGLHGEIEDTLRYLKEQDCTLVVGLRDVMDAPHLLKKEWKRRGILPKLDELYDDIWVYGPPGFWNPLSGLKTSKELNQRITYTGYLERHQPAETKGVINAVAGDYVLITTGGGGDGSDVVNNVLAAYEYAETNDSHNLLPAVMILGPFMPTQEREAILKRAEGKPNIQLMDFDNRIETLITDAKGLIGMGGYNTFCEILSFDKRAIVVPRTEPRQEQLIRARRADELGVIKMMEPDLASDPQKMADAIEALPKRRKPSEAGCWLPLDGLKKIGEIVEADLARPARPELRVIAGGG
ncbi:MAG: glycosyltransferase [Pseudomonadota bacterium]